MTSLSASSATHSSWLTAQLALCALAVVALLYIPIPILGQLTQAYHLPAAAAGYALSAFGIAYAGGFLIFGPLSDRLGRQRVMVAGLVALGLASLGFLWVRSSTGFFALRAIQGLAASSFPPVALAWLAERGTQQQRAWAVAWMSTAFLCAALLGQIYGGLVGELWGLGLSLLPLCAIYAITAFWLGKTGELITGGSENLSSIASVYSPLGKLLKAPELQKVYVPALVLLMFFVAFYLHLDTYFGADFQQVGISPLMARAVAVPALLAPLLIPKFIRRFGPKHVASAGLFFAATGLAMTAIASGRHDYRLVLAASVVYVFGVGVSVPGLIARVSSVAPASARGLAIAFYTFVLFIGASAGPWLAMQIKPLGADDALFWLAGLMGLLAIWSVLPVGKPDSSY